jgi:hypothetical protein
MLTVACEILSQKDCDIGGSLKSSHGGDHEEYCLQRCYAV